MKKNIFNVLGLVLVASLFSACSVKEEMIIDKNNYNYNSNLNLDKDKDGFYGVNDKCPNSKIGAKVDHKGCEFGSYSMGLLNNGINMNKKLVANFDFDKTDIRMSDAKKISYYVKYLKKYPNSKIVIEGHTDSVGTMSYNHRLGIKRALKIRKSIIDKGIAKNRIKVEYYGETMPVIDNKTEEHRAQNRRAVSRIIRK